MTTASRSLATALRMGALRERLAPPSYTTSWDTTCKLATGRRPAGMGRAYSEDLRRRIVAAVAGGLPCRRRHGSCGERELRDQAAAALASHWVGRARPEFFRAFGSSTRPSA